MRIKDDEKREALVCATIKLVNQVGFAASSVSKIAKEAGVSASTLYIYFKNKEDLLVSTYVDIKLEMSGAMLEGFDSARPIRDILKTVWFNTFYEINKHPERVAYTVQFASTPYIELLDKEEVEKHFKPLFDVLQRGIEQKILKNVGVEFFGAFMFYPILRIASDGVDCHGKKFSEDDIDTAFDMSWDAIKL